MIRDLSVSLRALLDDDALLGPDFPELAGAVVSFDRPTDSFNPAQDTIDLFLYEVRENADLRSNVPHVERQGTTAIVHPPPRRIDCSYLVTAWAIGAGELALREQRLLSQALQVLGRHPTLPSQYLVGSLVGQSPDLPVLAPDPDGVAAEFWTSLGNQLRASFTLTATVSLPVRDPDDDFLVTTRFLAAGPGEPETPWVAIAGRVTGNGQPLPGATVDVVDVRLRTHSDGRGQWAFSQVPTGPRTLRVVATGFQPLTRAVEVPAPAEAYQLTLNPLP